MKLEKLQNGSDIRGIAISTEKYSENLTVEAMMKIGNGIIQWLRKKKNKKYESGQLTIGIGCDSRLTGPALKDALTYSLINQGVQVIDFQLATTPAMFMSTKFSEFSCDAGIMLTASHLPYYFNGVKIFTSEGGADKSDIRFILNHVDSSNNLKLGSVKKANILIPYSKDLVKKIREGTDKKKKEPLKGLKIIVDAGNGSGGFFANYVLKPLGADTEGSQFLEPDGHFPNHIPNPDNKEAIESIRNSVLANNADLGVIFDTDVDRSAVITKSGDILNRNNLIAVLSSIILEQYPGTSIVTNSSTSSHLKDFIESLGGKQVRYISGYRNVINKALELNKQGIDTQLAIETSGHAAFKENYFLDDGAYVISKILMLLPKLQLENKTLEQLFSTLNQPSESQEVRFNLEEENYKPLGQFVINSISKVKVDGWKIDPENDEGIRFNLSKSYGSGWFLLRMSLHEPLLVLQVENDYPGMIHKFLRKLHQIFLDYPNVNQEKLLELI